MAWGKFIDTAGLFGAYRIGTIRSTLAMKIYFIKELISLYIYRQKEGFHRGEYSFFDKYESYCALAV